MSVNQMDLKQPELMDWANYNPGSKYRNPPPALDASGKAIVYNVALPQISDDMFQSTKDGYREYQIKGIKLVKNSPDVDGYELMYWGSIKKFEKNGKVTEASKAGNLLRGAGSAAKPQTNADYDNAIKQISGKPLRVTLDWRAKNKDTGEEVNGFRSFPLDPLTGQRKAILKAGDVVTDYAKDGTVIGSRTIKSEVMFANANIRSIYDPNRK